MTNTGRPDGGPYIEIGRRYLRDVLPPSSVPNFNYAAVIGGENHSSPSRAHFPTFLSFPAFLLFLLPFLAFFSFFVTFDISSAGRYFEPLKIAHLACRFRKADVRDATQKGRRAIFSQGRRVETPFRADRRRFDGNPAGIFANGRYRE